MVENYSIVIVGTGGQGVIKASSVLGWTALNIDENNKLRTAETHGMAQRGGSVIVHLRFGPTVESPLVNTKSADAILSFELVEAIRYLDFLKKDGILLVNKEIIIPPVLFRGQHVDVDPELCIGCGNCRINCKINNYFSHSNSLVVIDSPASKILNGVCQVQAGCTGCKACMGICSQDAIYLVQEISYPTYSDIEDRIKTATKNGYIIDASKIALEMGDIRMTNIIMIGALMGFESVPLNIETVEEAIRKTFKPKIVEKNLQALKTGLNLIKKLKKD